MKQGTSKKILVISLAILITLLLGVSIFIAYKIQNSQAPTSSSANSTCVWGWIGGGAGCNFFGCQDYLNDHPQCTFQANDPGTNNGPGSSCEQTGSAFVGSGCSGKTILKYTTSYNGGQSKCPTSENQTVIGTCGSNGCTLNVNPAPGTCEQQDVNGVGGICNCTPPIQTTTVQCNESCDSTHLCPTGLSCTSGLCRLPANPTSPTCQPTAPATPQCNEACSDTNPCATGLSCTNGLCRLPANPTSETCQPTPQCNETCSSSNPCESGLECINNLCRLPDNPTSATCQPAEVSLQCISLNENGSDPLAAGTGSFVEYSLTYQNPASTDPYTNIKLRVGTASSPVGRDANNTSSNMVAPYNVTHDAVNDTWTYLFRWEAASTSGIAVSAGTYNVRVLLDGTTATEVSTPSGCTETITISSTAVEEPLFTILKESAPVCETNGNATVNYTITVTNIGSVPGTIDFVQDTYDSQANTLGILPTNLDPSYGVVNAGTITWTGDNSQRTYSAGQAKQFKYTLTVPAANLDTFSSTGLLNQAVVQYDTSTTNNNTASFDLRTFLSCTVTIPNTGILDDSRFVLVGLIFIILGILVFKFGIGEDLSLLVVNKTSGLLSERTKSLLRKVMPYEESIIDEMERKREEK